MSNESDSIPKMMTFFADISRKTFSTSVLKKITNYAFMVLRIADSVFSADSLRKGLQEHFHPQETALFAPAMHTGIMSSGTRVAVTSARDMGQTACLITSYNHPSSSTTSSGNALLVEREESTDKDMKIWEAALATSAAPFYLPPFQKEETNTAYVDGAVYANCPAQAAYSEMERIWPDNGAPLDTLVSLGTGLQRRKPADDVPGLVNMGFFVSLRAMFQRQLDSKSSWAAFRDTSAPPSVRCRLRRLDPPLGREDYVELYDHRKIEELKAAVARWTSEDAAGEVQEIANALLANLFFFEPDEVRSPSATLSDPTLDALPGSIRCRFGHGTPELKRLLGEMVEGFYHVRLPPCPNSAAAAVDALKEVARVPRARWGRITAEGIRGRDARPGEMLVGEHGVQKFRLPYAFGVRKGSTAVQVLGVKLMRCEHLVPISGFPSSMADLGRRAKMVWLQ
jgi:predicted acylesterase/phospholipase RssA